MSSLAAAFWRACNVFFAGKSSRVGQVTQDEDSENWLVMQVVNMQKPSQACMNTIMQGSFDLDGQRLVPGLWEEDALRPPFFFHGTSVPTMFQILTDGGLKSSGHCHPDGIFSFGLQDRSSASSYVQWGGVQICFRSPGLVMSMNNSGLFRACPPGVILRTWRSSSKKFKAAGREWVHNSESIEIVGARIHPGAAQQWLLENFPQFLVGLQFDKPMKVPCAISVLDCLALLVLCNICFVNQT